MNKKFEVAQVGLGPMGKIIARLLLKRENISLSGVVDIDPNLSGKDLSELLNDKKGTGLVIDSDLKEILSKGTVDVTVIATSSSFEKVTPLITLAVES
jgi:4-hydroxy-tetrahydrodipicolinate reductase